MVKQGPCRHCGVTSTPLWRNGPPEKPVLCNACGSRWRTRGTLANYTPMHRRDDVDVDEPRFSNLKPPISKPRAQRPLKKTPVHTIMENGLFSCQNFQKMGDAEPSNRTSSGSAVSYSESCAQYGAADASEMTGSAQSKAWESMVPSRKRSSLIRRKPSAIERLVKDLTSVMQEEPLCYLSGSSEDDLIYHSETPMGSFEMGSGSVLLRNPNLKSLEEESEASSIPADSKSFITNESYSGSASFIAHSGSKTADNINSTNAKLEMPPLQIEDNARRDKLHHEYQHVDLESADSPLVSVDLEDIISYSNFTKYLTMEEQKQLFKLLPQTDYLTPTESLRSMFSSIHFAEDMRSYQSLLEEGILDPLFSGDEEWKTVKELALTNLTKCKWLECYKQQKEKEIEKTGGNENISGTKGVTISTMRPMKRPRDAQFQGSAELKVTMRSPKRVFKSGGLPPQCKSLFLPKPDYVTKDLACTGGALNLLDLPKEKLSLLVHAQYSDINSDQDLLLEVLPSARQPEAELLQPSQLTSVTRSSTSVVRVAEGEECLKQP